MVEIGEMVSRPPEALALAAAALLAALVVGYLAKILLRRVAESTGVYDFARGTTFDRVVESLGTSTVDLVTAAFAWLIYVSGALVALEVLGVRVVDEGVLATLTAYLPNIVVAAFVLVLGFVVADKIAMKTKDRLSEVRVSDVMVVPAVVRYSIIFVAVLMAATQIGVSTTALHVLFAAYVLALVVFAAVGGRTVLPSAVAGLYVLVTQPYGVGDRVSIGDVEGVVQEIDLLTTRIDDDEHEHVLPNDRVFEHGVRRDV
ncbi:MAG: mechanosensitive ion channel family protein [Halobacteriota archaeon]